MISTVTTTVTVSTYAVGTALGALSTVLLILLLASKELASTDNRRVLKTFDKASIIGILPLIISFSFTIIGKITEVL